MIGIKTIPATQKGAKRQKLMLFFSWGEECRWLAESFAPKLSGCSSFTWIDPISGSRHDPLI